MQTVLEIANKHFDDESFQLFKAMYFEETKTVIPEKFLHDFLTTVRSPPVKHKQFSVLPSTSFTDNHPMNKDCIISICNKTNTNLLRTNLLHSILCKIGHVIKIVVHQFVRKTTAKKNISSLKKTVPLDPKVCRNT